MASKKIYDVVTSTGSYTGQDGQEKKRWLTVGVVFQNDEGYVSMKLDAIPAKRNDQGEMWLSLFVPKPREQKPAQQQGFREPQQPRSDGFADPDLPAFIISDEWLAEIRQSMEAIPSELKALFIDEYKLSVYDASVLTEDKLMADWFQTLVKAGIDAKLAANWVMGPVKTHLNLQQTSPFRLQLDSLIELMNLVIQKKVNYNVAVKQILPELVKGDTTNARDLVDKLGLAMDSADDGLEELIAKVIAEMPTEVAAYKKGKKAVIQRFIGEVMKRSRGKAEPQATMTILKKMLTS